MSTRIVCILVLTFRIPRDCFGLPASLLYRGLYRLAHNKHERTNKTIARDVYYVVWGSILCTMEPSYTHAFKVYLWHGGTFKYGAYIVRRYTQQINIRNLCYKLYYICTRAARIVDMQKTILYPVDLLLCKCSCFCVQYIFRYITWFCVGYALATTIEEVCAFRNVRCLARKTRSNLNHACIIHRW